MRILDTYTLLVYLCSIKSITHQKSKTMKKQVTVAELRRILFDNEKLYAVIGEHEYTNEDARWELYCMKNQDANVNYIQDGDCLLCWF